jgi:MoaA/NifB/PqqE/SkfB family radical SAM enzyme
MSFIEENIPFHPSRDTRRNVEINLGKACNNRCVFCLDGLPKKEDRSYLKYDVMRRELTTWYQEGHRSVGFLGGEPTTHPQIVQAVGYAKELGFTRIAIATNATKLRLTHFTDKLVEAGLTRVTVSMHGHTAELEDRLTRVPGNFEKKCTAIRYLQKKQAEGYLRDGVSVNIVLNGWNYRYLPKMMKFFYETMGLPDIRVNFVRPEGYAENNADLTPRYTDVQSYVLKAVILNEQHFKKTLTFGGFPLCMLPKRLLNDQRLLKTYIGELRDLTTDCSTRDINQVSVIGFDAPAPYLSKIFVNNPKFLQRYQTDKFYADVRRDASHMYNVPKQDLGSRHRFNWQERKRVELKGHPKSCSSCDLESVCEGVWQGYLDIWSDDEFQAVSSTLLDK